MINYLLKLFVLLLFSVFIIFNYYFVYWWHLTSFDGYIFYVVFILFIYAIYKLNQLNNSKEIAYFKNTHLLGYFVLNLFVTCLFFFKISPAGLDEPFVVSGIVLFFRVLFFSILPIVIFVITTSFAKYILQKLPDFDKLSNSFSLLLSIWLGISLFVTSIVIFAAIGFYNLFVVFAILAIFTWFSRKQIIDLSNSFLQKEYKLSIKEWSYLKLISTEFFALLSFFVLTVALVTIIRPFPIGWDDLGVYMNYPHLIAEAWNLLSLTSMYSWQAFTSIGYLFSNPTQAFFINVSGLFISFLVLNIVFSDLLKPKEQNKKSFLNLGLILSTIFISLPMITFLSSKDMKVDAGLFFITVIALYSVIKYFLYEKDNSWEKLSIIYLFIIWLIAWFAFSVKFTALLFIVSVLAIITYNRLSIIGFIWYIAVFFWFFTLFGLWSMMNVVINPYNIAWFENIFWWTSVIIGTLLLWVGFVLIRQNSIRYIKEILIFLAWVVVILTPWFSKNIIESYPNISISSILNWKWDRFVADFSSIYSDEELTEIKEFYSNERKKENSITTNEDLLRYFGYSNGILDYVYMPWNLTMQKNQSWEYTDIWFLFLALLPLIFIFLRYKHPLFPLFFVILAFIQFISYIPAKTTKISIENLSNISTESLSWVLSKDDSIFSIDSSKNIYQIDFWKYISDEDLAKTIWENELVEKTRELILNEATNKAKQNSKNWTADEINSLVTQYSSEYLENFDYYKDIILKQEIDILKQSSLKIFYEEIKQKILDWNYDWKISFMVNPLSDNDIEYIKSLWNQYNNYYVFESKDIAGLKKDLDSIDLEQSQKDLITDNWSSSRNISWKIVDFFSSINIPLGYLYVFLWFFVPTIYLLFTLKNTRLNQIFILNLVFASLYTFLWMISSFGIVWYGITMYFSFLLMIWLSAYSLVVYNEEEYWQKDYFIKMFISFIFLSIFLIYVFNSIIPNVSNNLKSWWYEQYKVWEFSSDEAIFAYHKDYLNILYTLNVDETKNQEFLEEYISEDIISLTPNILNFEISDILSILNSIIRTDNSKLDPSESRAINIKNEAKKSKERLYKNIANPSDEYKNKEKIYRIGTFLKYYISENNSRLWEDNLLFKFNDYIYSDDLNETISRMKTIWIKYLLVDLNAATIDNSETKDLTNRYEKLLSSFVSDDLNLISTDSICLEVWLERYKETQNMEEYMLLSGINYESYTDYWDVIPRWNKRNECARYIDFLLENDLVNQESYSFLLPYKIYFENRERTPAAISNIIWTTYKALFEIK